MAKYTRESKCISYLLRHGAEKVGLRLNNRGYALVSELLAKCAEHGYIITEHMLEEIVNADTKGRYGYTDKQQYVRANQGHSLSVDLGLNKKVPPVELFHGTGSKSYEDIIRLGIEKMNRQHVHLSDNMTTAYDVGQRHGKPVIFVVDCKRMLADGVDFYLSNNGVWLVDFVDRKYFSSILIHPSRPTTT